MKPSFDPTRTELNKLTKELKKKIWSVNDEILHLKCLNQNLKEQLKTKKHENLALLDLKRVFLTKHHEPSFQLRILQCCM